MRTESLPGRLSMSQSTPTLSVIIVCYRQWPETARLVRQLRRSPAIDSQRAEVILVDNHSPPRPVLARLRRMEGVSVRRWKRNMGFARGANEGQRLSRGQWSLLLNPDVSVGESFLEEVLALIEELEQQPRTGIVGLGVRNTNGSRQPSTGSFPNLGSTLARLLLPPTQRKHHFGHSADPRRVEWVSGCCTLIRRECFEQVGGFDPGFFLYYEDVDLCKRALAHGWEAWYHPRPTVTHHYPLQQRKRSTLLQLLTRHALLTYAYQHWPTWQARLLTRIVQIETRALLWLVRRRGSPGNERLLEVLQEMVGAMRRDEYDEARRRLNGVVRIAEKRAHDRERKWRKSRLGSGTATLRRVKVESPLLD